MTGPAGNAPIAEVLEDLLQRSHLVAPETLAEEVTDAARPLGIAVVRVYLADLQQRWLRELAAPGGRPRPAMKIDTTLAGRAYQTIDIQSAGAGERHLWVPLVNGTERLGVMEVVLAEGHDPGKDVREQCRALASLTAMILASKSVYSDTYAKVQREREMSVPAELEWAFMPPRTFATHRVIVAASLEPAYEVGGDAFDHSLLGDLLHVSLFDSVGHDLTAGLISSVAMATCRATRRAGGTLADLAIRADRVIAEEFGESRFATALLCELDTATGQFDWIPCGHPPPLLIRDGRVVKQLLREPRLPLGLAEDRVYGEPPYTERLQAGDRLLLYTDGIVEARSPDGREFGLARLGDFVIRHSAEGLSASETLRRLIHAILDYQREPLRDDATVLLVEWLPPDPEPQLTA